MSSPEAVIAFWREAGREKWFVKDEALDLAIRERFLDLHFRAARSELSDWSATAKGTLALLILLDQFPRNLFRGSGHAFATDPLALSLAKQALAKGFDQQVEPPMTIFFYLPFEHSEDPAEQEHSMALFTAYHERVGDEECLRYAEVHQNIIARFGRFPHRNPALGRETTPEEQAYLDADGFKG
ncbi:hypothetical protein ASE36_17215 [Rhizobium sp. Root274]|uniref:DUF924 family protein n=1 Tax=unclassified Rhizobium TaxID=2613769 RepID=UPI000714E2CF|nr:MULTISPECIES: DUF924 family protein [unclassified Rhizobium]KQW28170.1 hypothetical protein ASC71_17245 [Rhizobium sp. Root1240]KRD28456.1 hypothetical protein ASE36_17215 [Rhizobium sp. Root274]